MLLLAYEVILFIWAAKDIFGNIGAYNSGGKIDSRRRLFVSDDEFVLSLPHRELGQYDAFKDASNLLK
tara:strand:- start:233 stop:436 length:204 start_codon:yes stop_codon:yes gene_type:complete